MSEYLGIYFFFALFCAVPQIDPDTGRQQWVPFEEFYLDKDIPNQACYIGRDPGMPPSWTGLPGADPEYYDV